MVAVEAHGGPLGCNVRRAGTPPQRWVPTPKGAEFPTLARGASVAGNDKAPPGRGFWISGGAAIASFSASAFVGRSLGPSRGCHYGAHSHSASGSLSRSRLFGDGTRRYDTGRTSSMSVQGCIFSTWRNRSLGWSMTMTASNSRCPSRLHSSCSNRRFDHESAKRTSDDVIYPSTRPSATASITIALSRT